MSWLADRRRRRAESARRTEEMAVEVDALIRAGGEEGRAAARSVAFATNAEGKMALGMVAFVLALAAAFVLIGVIAGLVAVVT